MKIIQTKKLLTVLAAAVIMLTGCQSDMVTGADADVSRSESVGHNSIVSGEGYSLDTGDSWLLADDKYSGTDNSAEHTFVLSEINNEEDAQTVIVFQIIDPVEYSDSEKFGHSLSGQYKDGGSVIIDEGVCTVNNYDAYEVVHNLTVRNSDTVLKSRHVVIVHDQRLYSFILAALPQKYDSAVVMMNEMLSSFTIE